jgi:hypothetical protein
MQVAQGLCWELETGMLWALIQADDVGWKVVDAKRGGRSFKQLSKQLERWVHANLVSSWKLIVTTDPRQMFLLLLSSFAPLMHHL